MINNLTKEILEEKLKRMRKARLTPPNHPSLARKKLESQEEYEKYKKKQGL